MDFILEGLKGVTKSTDDLLIYGKTEAENDERVRQVLHRLEENRVTCNILKCSFSKREQDFVGHHTSQGIQPLRSKIDAIINFPQPTNIQVISGLGNPHKLCRPSSLVLLSM